MRSFRPMQTSKTVDDFLAQSTPDRTFILEFMLTDDEFGWRHIAPLEYSAVPHATAIQKEDLERCLSTNPKAVHPSHHCTSNHGMGQMALRRRALQSLTDAEKEERRKLLNRECQRRFRERRLLRANQTKNKSSRAYTSHPQFSNLKSSRHDSWQ